MLREQKLTSQLLNTLQQGGITKIIRGAKDKNIELRREVGNNSFFADILISLSSQKSEEKSFNTKQTKFIAIEVKISDWKQGLYQAWRYYSFAEKSYLALYEDYAKNIEIDSFKKHNVGLIVFNENTIKVLHHPTTNNFKGKDTYEINLREKIWQRSLAIQSVQPVV
ncbi:MAG: hypothetical protein L6Q29_01280 [Candidatus Pacebacteria bacterium]|nr:hypothetical protein [Candidatus Paceibacterota bacterium]NUQ57691.1 hypothetical protein [Candidatus Paceibacter sp.]